MSPVDDASARYRVTAAKGEERSSGPVDAAVSMTIPAVLAAVESFDATAEFMRGRLKVEGPTGALFERLASGEATAALKRLASPS